MRLVNMSISELTDGFKRYASGYHLHMTSRRFFIGPIPEGWLQHHRKHWYKTRLKFHNYTSRAVTFTADTTTPTADQPEPEAASSSAREQHTSLADTTIQVAVADRSGEEGDDRETDEQPGGLQSIPYPLTEAETPRGNTRPRFVSGTGRVAAQR